MTDPQPTPQSNPPPADAKTLQPTARKPLGLAFSALCWLATWASVAILAVLLVSVVIKAWGWIDIDFLRNFDSSRKPEDAGILAGLWGTFWVISLTICFSVPVGIGAAIYLEEYASDNWMTRLIRTNLANLAGVPSIVYGILGLTAFVRMFSIFADGGLVEDLTGRQIDGVTLWTTAEGDPVRIPLPFGPCVVSGALTLSLLILPVIIVASQESLRAVPGSLRHASLALGATRWQTIRHQVLPAGIPGIMTGVILAISRAIGETAPLIVAGAVAFVYFAPGNVESPKQLLMEPESFVEAPFDKYTVLPIQVYNWSKMIKPGFHHRAAAAVFVLLLLLLLLNGTATLIRHRHSKRLRW